MRLSIVYSHPDKQLNVTLCPAEFLVPPLKPLLSLNRDLSLYVLENMYLGLTASTGSIRALHYMVLLHTFPGAAYLPLEFGRVPILPPYPKKSSDRLRTILAVCLTLAVFAVFVVSGIGFIFYLRHKKVKEVLEEWEIQYGPHSFGNIFYAAEGSTRQEQNRGEIELVLKLGVLCAHQSESIRPDMSVVMRILNGVVQLPDNLLDVVRDEILKGRPETSMEILFDVNSIATLTFTNSFISHGR
ncbi:unnamed protein product [Arabidopsis arenosa]|uniref:Legume lectin domain-containing protein n=1 Tax=Arabidopsis arenosa TaxID=38785 RepID=A0A8S2ACY3_ARAAE|nr:unnamed protein product [Arabidopsis arenosa]